MAYGIFLVLGHLGRGHAEFRNIEDRIVAEAAVSHGLFVQDAADFASYSKLSAVRSYDCDAADELGSSLLFRNVLEHLEDLRKLLRICGILTAESCGINARSAVKIINDDKVSLELIELVNVTDIRIVNSSLVFVVNNNKTVFKYIPEPQRILDDIVAAFSAEEEPAEEPAPVEEEHHYYN